MVRFWYGFGTGKGLAIPRILRGFLQMWYGLWYGFGTVLVRAGCGCDAGVIPLLYPNFVIEKLGLATDKCKETLVVGLQT